MTTTLNLAINIQDADTADLMATLKLRYATAEIPNPTNVQLRNSLEKEVREEAAKWTWEYRKKQARAGVVAPVLT